MIVDLIMLVGICAGPHHSEEVLSSVVVVVVVPEVEGVEDALVDEDLR